MTGGKVHAIVRRQTVTCRKCGYECGVAVWIPHEWTLGDGRTTTGGFRPADLCPTCDLNDPHAAALAMFLRFHEDFPGTDPIDPGVIAQLSDLIERWLPHAKVPVVSEEDFDADVKAWREGEFD